MASSINTMIQLEIKRMILRWFKPIMLYVSIEWWWQGCGLKILQSTLYGLSVKYWMLSLQSKNPYQKMRTKICIAVCTLVMIGRRTWIASRMNILVIQKWKVSIQQQHNEQSLVLSKMASTVGGKKLLTLEIGWQWVRVELLDGLKV